MAASICPACGCCNHCDSRHTEYDIHPEALCPMDPDVTREQVSEMLRANGISEEEEREHLSTVMMIANLSMAKQARQNRIDAALTALQDGDTGDCTTCGEEGGTNKDCSACTAIMHLDPEANTPC